MSTFGLLRASADTPNFLNSEAIAARLLPRSSTGTRAPVEIRSRISCAFLNDTPLLIRKRATSTGCEMAFARRMKLTAGESEWLRGAPGVFPRRSSASLKDNFVDIGFYQQLSANCIEAGASKCSWAQTVNMGLAHMKNTANPGYVSYDSKLSDGVVITASITSSSASSITSESFES